MRFQPKSEEDLKKENLCPDGLYPFTVLQAAEKQSKTGKDMIALKLNVHGDDGRDYHIYDYVSPEFMAYKLRHFAVTVGLEVKYDAGVLTADDCVAREGWCDIGHKIDKEYGPKNIVRDYGDGDEPEAKDEAGKESPAPASVSTPPTEDDDVPF